MVLKVKEDSKLGKKRHYLAELRRQKNATNPAELRRQKNATSLMENSPKKLDFSSPTQVRSAQK